jgi:hypothetical protein
VILPQFATALGFTPPVQVQPDLQQAVEVDNTEATDNLRNQLAAYCEVLDAGFSKLGVKQQSQIWLQVRVGKCSLSLPLVKAQLKNLGATVLLTCK